VVWQLGVVVAPCVNETAAAFATRSSSALRAAYVLVIGREQAMLELIAYIFRRAAIESISTCSIASALQSIEAQPPAVVVIDSYGIQMTPQLTHVVGSPIVVLTTDEPDDVMAMQALGQVEYVHKPFTGKELVARVRVHLSRLEA